MAATTLTNVHVTLDLALRVAHGAVITTLIGMGTATCFTDTTAVAGTGHSRTGTLPPNPDKLRGRIRLGEFVDLSLSLHSNLTQVSSHR